MSRETARFADRAISPPSLRRPEPPDPRRLVLPRPSCRRRELPLGDEPILPVRADGPAPLQPVVVGVGRDLLAGGSPVLPPRAAGRRDAPWLDPPRLGRAHRRGRR